MTTNSHKVEFQNEQGETLAGRLEQPTQTPRAFAVFAHCFTCSKDIAAASRISRALCHRGIAVLRFDFTGLGNSEGDFANTNFSSNIQDLVAAADHLREHRSAPSLLVGHSLGGAAVLAAATHVPEVRAIATIGAPSDPAHVQHLFQNAQDDIRQSGQAAVDLAGRQFVIKKQFLDDLQQHSARNALGKLIQQSVLIMHSPADDVVDIDHARRIYQSIPHPKSFVSLDDADHLLSRRQDSEYVAEVLSAWCSRYVETAPEQARLLPSVGPGEVLVVETGDGFAQEIRTGSHGLRADEPVKLGGTDTGPDPYGLLLASLGACTSMTMRMYTRRKKWPVEKIAVRLRHEKVHAADCEACESTTGRIDRIERVLEVEGSLDEEQRARLLEIADRCPVHRTLEGAKQISTRYA